MLNTEAYADIQASHVYAEELVGGFKYSFYYQAVAVLSLIAYGPVFAILWTAYSAYQAFVATSDASHVVRTQCLASVISASYFAFAVQMHEILISLAAFWQGKPISTAKPDSSLLLKAVHYSVALSVTTYFVFKTWQLFHHLHTCPSCKVRKLPDAGGFEAPFLQPAAEEQQPFKPFTGPGKKLDSER